MLADETRSWHPDQKPTLGRAIPFRSNSAVSARSFLAFLLFLDYLVFLCLNLSRCCRLSTGYTSVHGERPSAEYAKLRKESLETEFGHILGAHGSKTWFAYHRFGPFLALYRAAIISFYLAKLTVWHFFVRDIHKRAAKVYHSSSKPLISID